MARADTWDAVVWGLQRVQEVGEHGFPERRDALLQRHEAPPAVWYGGNLFQGPLVMRGGDRLPPTVSYGCYSDAVITCTPWLCVCVCV